MCRTPPAGQRQPGCDRCKQGAQQTDRRAADLLAHQNRVVDADRRHQQQAEQAEQRQWLTEPAKARQTAQRRQQRQRDNAQRAAEPERQDQQQDDQYAGQQFEFGGADLCRGKHSIQFAQAIHQLHAFKILRLHAQQRRIIQALQADQPGDAIVGCTQPKGAPGFAEWSGQYRFDIGIGQRLQARQFGLQGRSRYAKINQRLPLAGQLTQRAAGCVLIGRCCDQLIERHIALQFFHAHQLIKPLTQRRLAFEQLLLILAAHQEKLAGGLETGDARDGLGFVG